MRIIIFAIDFGYEYQQFPSIVNFLYVGMEGNGDSSLPVSRNTRLMGGSRKKPSFFHLPVAELIPMIESVT
jgi:hypothetical protein